jgi:Icc-related predicted phosphoesterase
VVFFFASDIHGSVERYEKLWSRIGAERPGAVLLGGDLLPRAHPLAVPHDARLGDFTNDFLAVGFERLRDELGDDYPRVLVILGNDDAAFEEDAVRDAEERRIWEYIHNRRVGLGGFTVYGYSYVPPTPFLLKDWERYDVSRYVDPGSVSPEEGLRSVPGDEREIRYSTIEKDLRRLAGDDDLTRAVFLFHSPPYDTTLDRAALDGRRVDHVPMDVHVGSIAIKRFIEARQPLVTLHGHVHESAQLTGSWHDSIGRTHIMSAAHHGPELALVRFDPDAPDDATRELC